ncbi:hypothetical protein QBC47DRAFT_54335 [Echria macrotheca]|uniref:NFX1-type zinc finger-containing protein 1 n=1 Tax=Echria macrotheca TaxID=438768 RepID=A0AAJ0BCB5_9PEZI|nr:hypothetical protein QBC47DRAFT_54335 [Echria macrotheca]
MSDRPQRRVASSANSMSPSKPCPHFQRNKCRFGAKCKFSHDTQKPQDQRIATQPRPGEGKLREWKRLLEQGSQILRPTATTVSRFFQLGLELMEGDIGGAQDVVKMLATDKGLSFVRDVTDRHIPARQANLWVSEIRPLFLLITHPLVVDSAVLEQQVATIFNYLYGIGGARMTSLFGCVVQQIQSWPSSATEASRFEALELAASVLSKMLDCNTTNIIDPKFGRIASDLDTCFQEPAKVSQGEHTFSQLQTRKYLDYIRQRLDVGDEILPVHARPGIPVIREQFVMRRDLPGKLSAEGPRHDNDHAAISDIKILPTYEEIMSPRAEYLPTTDSTQWHVQGIRGRLDREFRLLREDTVGQLRDAIRETLEAIRNPQKDAHIRSKNSARTYTYDSPTPVNVSVDQNGHPELTIRCNQPPHLKQLSLKKRKEWWTQSKRLQSGALVCILDATGSVLFCTVSDATLRTSEQIKERLGPQQKDAGQDDGAAGKTDVLTLADDADHLYLTLQLVEPTKHDLGQALRWYQNVGSCLRRYLVEFPGVLLASFKHTLTALQDMYLKPKMPFTNLLAPTDGSSSEITVNQPQYARRPGFQFDLGCLTDGKGELVVNPRNPPSPGVIAARTNLDETQSVAMLDTLSRELSVIQGPPGTGKSYTGEKIIQGLLANKEKASLGPILCVTYTNHANDQLLEHLLDHGIEKIVRIGSRSKSERLQDLNIRNVVKQFERTKAEKSTLFRLDKAIRNHVRDADSLLKRLSAVGSRASIKDFLERTSIAHHDELFGKKDDDGWQVVNNNPERTVDRWLATGLHAGKADRPLCLLQGVRLCDMTYGERQRLHRYWLTSIRDKIITEILAIHQECAEQRTERDRLRKDVDLRCLQQADVIGVTTTGLARQLDVLRKLRCKVLVCEEAGEVLEAHILTALLPSVEHAVLIGDHLQLRPQIQNYDLQSTNPRGQQYSLDVSLFERLVSPPTDSAVRIPFSVLETQRRMSPSIAELVRSTLYPSLKDAEKVCNYPKVVGMDKRLFWLHHDRPEAGAANNDPLSTSHSNEFEVHMTTALVSHLVRQGAYTSSDIAVITPYLGQLQRLRRRMESMFEICLNDRDQQEVDALEAESSSPVGPSPRAQLGKTSLLKSIRIATVDNFQGEEAKVVIISLVRSNPQANCGFLRTPNRINVLLSRAQHGMYIIGNSNTYESVPMWAKVIRILQEQGNFGRQLGLQCPRHAEKPLLVSEPDDFVVVAPDGGCSLQCEQRLDCGHACLGRCHSDMLHKAVKCLEDCPRFKKGCDHPCPLRCGDACQPKCMTVLESVELLLPCGHRVPSPRCYEAQDPASVRCTAQVTRIVPGCSHQVKARCHEDVSAANYRCNAVCGTPLPCGHNCVNPCHRCNTRKDGKTVLSQHETCTQRCAKDYSTCRHSCSEPCHGDAPHPPCRVQCEVRCSHSRCGKLCHEPCAPCAEQSCASSCPHTSCTMPCAAPCDWVPCSKRCEKILECGHRCPSVCGQMCPDSMYCQICASDQVLSACVDFLEMREYREIDLNAEPCIFPDCGHFLTISSMDGQMDMGAHYEIDGEGLPVKLLAASTPFSSGSVGNASIRVCPSCRGSLRNISRYGRIVNRGMLDEATKKFISWSNAEYARLAQVLAAEQKKLADMPPPRAAQLASQSPNTPKNQAFAKPRRKNLNSLQRIVGGQRYVTMIGLWESIRVFATKVREEEQPLQRVADLVKHANRENRARGGFQFDETAIQVKGSLLSRILQVRCEMTLFSDFFSLSSKGKLSSGGASRVDEVKIDWSVYIDECKAIIQLAEGAMYRREEVQAHIFAAQMCMFARRYGTAPDSEAENAKQQERLKREALEHVSMARSLVAKYPSTSSLEVEIDSVERAINGGTFYSEVTSDEVRAIYATMSADLGGTTGHWYTCQNGHPFTVGECGMPMEQAKCPECDAPVGGSDHIPAAGVTRASSIERLAAGVERVRL